MVTQQELKRLFKLERRTGSLVRLISRGKAPAGTSSTAKDRDGYLVVGVNGKVYRAHRLVWLYVHGSWPEADIDHINRIKDDNRPRNLRAVSRSQNKQNQGPMETNKSGAKGVFKAQGRNAWAASICHEGKNHYLGAFPTIKQAAAAYAAAAAVFHTHNNASAT